MIWLGWTSNCWASSASVFSPLTAAKATFALKAGVWFRRGRLLIVSPALRPSWPPPGRNSTYPTCSKIPSQLCSLEVPRQSGNSTVEVGGLGPGDVLSQLIEDAFARDELAA